MFEVEINQKETTRVKRGNKKVNWWRVATLVMGVWAAAATATVVFLLLSSKNRHYSPPTNSFCLPQESFPSPTPPSGETPKPLSLGDFPDKELLAEDSRYQVYLIEKSLERGPEKQGRLLVYDKEKGQVSEIEGNFSIFGSVKLYADLKGNYLLLSTGTSFRRRVIPLSLLKQRRATEDFCTLTSLFFWQDYVIYGTCEQFDNRPWESGEASSLAALKLATGEKVIIKKADLTHQYSPQKIVGNILYYQETSVAEEKDWQREEAQKTVSQTYDLLQLLKRD